ncbi:Replication factor A protein 1 [Pichia californica]|nr:Replication factor A protein 1 [[Candida] californica]
MMINDGKWYLNAVFKPTDQQKVLENFSKFAVIKVTNFSISCVNNKYFLLLNECKVIENPNRSNLNSNSNSNSNANFENLDHYLRDHPDENVFQKTLDSAAASATPAADTNPAATPITVKPQPIETSKLNSNPNPNPNPNSNQHQHQPPPPQFKGMTTIDQLSPYQSVWSIKARVSYKGDMRTWTNSRGNGKLFSVHLMDETGEIKATAFNQVAEKFFDIFQENSVYYISKCSLQQAKKQFSNLSNDYEINLDKDSLILPCIDDSDIPKLNFDFINLKNIQNLENNSIIDVIGIIKEIGELKQINSKATGKPYDRRDITIVDQSQIAVNIGLWNKSARDFNLNNGTPVAFKGCKVNDFNGKQLSLIPSAVIMSNPDLPEAYKLKGWYDNEGSNENFINLRNNSSNNNNNDLISIDSILKRISIKDANDSKLGFNENPDYFTIKATVTYIKTENFSYPACCSTDCSKKVIQQTNHSWRCEKCSLEFPEPDYRYILTCSVVDETGQMWLNLFNNEGITLIGCDAKTLIEKKQDLDTSLLKNYLNENVLYKEYALKIRARLDSYQGIERARFQCIGLSPINPSNESDALVTLIDKLQV